MPSPKTAGSLMPDLRACLRINLSGMRVSRPAPSPLLPSASTPPRCASRIKASSARSTISREAAPPIWATRPTPQASWSVVM